MTARRDIEPEEELTYDYATTDTIGTSSSLLTLAAHIVGHALI